MALCLQSWSHNADSVLVWRSHFCNVHLISIILLRVHGSLMIILSIMLDIVNRGYSRECFNAFLLKEMQLRFTFLSMGRAN